MKLSKTTEYAIRILCFMASNEDKIHSAKSILEKIKIPQKYMRRIMTDLSKNNFIQSTHGREGGYRFLKSPDSIFLSDIIEAVEGMEKYVGCILGFNECSGSNPCAMHNSWVDTREKLFQTLTKTNLSDLTSPSIEKQ